MTETEQITLIQMKYAIRRSGYVIAGIPTGRYKKHADCFT
jgi:hypothetical protein